MSPINIGLLGHNGLVGAPLLKALVAFQEEGKAKVIVIHRPNSKTDSIPSNVEKRTLDLSKPDSEDSDAAVKDLHVVISAVAGSAISDQLNIFPALSRSKTFQTFFPSDFGAAWSEEELKEFSADFIQAKEPVISKARELGVSTTEVKNGLISDFVFNFPIQFNVKENQVFVYRKSQETPIPYATTGYIAAGVVELLKRPLDSLKNKAFSLAEYKPTGQEITSIYGKIHGSEPQVISFDDEKVRAGTVDTNPFVSLGFAALRKSGRGWWDTPHIEEVSVEGWQSKGVEYEIKKVLSA